MTTRTELTELARALTQSDNVTNMGLTGAVGLPVGTNAQRPTGDNGLFRGNTTNNALEMYETSAWAAAKYIPLIGPTLVSSTTPFASGAGTLASPYVINVRGATNFVSTFPLTTLFIRGTNADQALPIVDTNPEQSAGRFSLSTNTATGGVMSIGVFFNDSPSSTLGTVYIYAIEILGVYVTINCTVVASPGNISEEATPFIARSGNSAQPNNHASASNGTFMVSMLEAKGKICYTDDGINFEAQLIPTAVTTGSFFDILWDGTKFVYVGGSTGNAVIATSSSHLISTLASVYSGVVANILKGVAYSGTNYAAVGNAGQIVTSNNGTSWTSRGTITTVTLNKVIWAGTQYVAVGDAVSGAGVIFTSPDGITWTSRVSGTPNNLHAIAWDGSLYVAVGEQGTIITSPNATTWTTRTSGIATTESFFGVQFVPGLQKFVAFGQHTVMTTSFNGINWTQVQTGDSNFNHNSNIQSTMYSSLSIVNGTYVFAKSHPTDVTSSGGSFLASRNFIDFVDTTAHVGHVRLINGRYIVPLSNGQLRWSTDGFTWNYQRVTSSGCRLNDIAYNGNVYVVTSTELSNFAVPSPTVYVSPDFENWTRVYLPSATSTAVAATVRSIAWNGTVFAVVGGNAVVTTITYLASSPDGFVWTFRTSPTNRIMRSVIWSGTRFVAVGDAGHMLYSNDGLTWLLGTRPNTNARYQKVKLLNGIFVAVGGNTGGTSNDAISTSPDGITWTQINSVNSIVNSQLFDVIYYTPASLFVAIGGTTNTFASIRITSPDGVTWTRLTTTEDRDPQAMFFTGTHIFELGRDGANFISPEGIVETLGITKFNNYPVF